MIDPSATPLFNIAPRKPIDLRPVYPDVQKEPRSFWELQYEESLALERKLRAERMWACVVATASARGGAVRMPLDDSQSARGEFVVDCAVGQRAEETPTTSHNNAIEGALDDASNSTGQTIPGSVEEFEQFVGRGEQWTSSELAMLETYRRPIVFADDGHETGD